MEQAAQKDLEGIRGWLVVAVVGLLISPILIGLGLYQNHLLMFSDGTWQALTSPTSASYHPLWAPLLLFEIVGNLVVIALALATLYFLFNKSRRTPAIAISWLLAGLVFVVSDFFLAQLIPAIANQPTDSEPVREIVRSV